MRTTNQLTTQTDHNGRKFIADHYIYKAIVSELTPGASLTTQVPIEADADFYLYKMAYFSDIGGAAQTEDTRVIPLVRVSITDSGSGRNLQNLPVPIDSMAGRGNLPFNLAQPRIFKANSNIGVTFTSFADDVTYANVELSFIGFKKFYL